MRKRDLRCSPTVLRKTAGSVKRKGILEHYSSKQREMTSPYCSGFLKKEEPGQERKDMVKAIYSMGLGVACFASMGGAVQRVVRA